MTLSEPTPAARREKRSRRWALNVASAVVALVVSVALLELLVRYGDLYPRNYPAPGLYLSDAEVGYRLRPNYSGTYVKGGRSFHVATNAQGFRDRRDFDDAVPAESRRVLVIGDSLVFGMPIEAKDTFVAGLERQMNDCSEGSPWQVLNAGVPGYGTRQQAVVLERLLPRLEPDSVVLSFYVGNDIDDNRRSAASPARRVYRGALVRPEVVDCARSPWCDRWYQMRLFARRSVLQEMVRDAWMRVRRDFPPPRYLELASPDWSPELQDAWRHTVGALEAIVSQCEEREIPLIILVLPTKMEVRDPSNEDLARPRLLVHQWLKGAPVVTVDPTADLIRGSQAGPIYETHGTHLIEPGHRIVARVLARAVEKTLLGDPC